MKILVSDSLSKQGVEVLEKAGFTVVVKTKLPKEELLKEIEGCRWAYRPVRDESHGGSHCRGRSLEGGGTSRFRLG